MIDRLAAFLGDHGCVAEPEAMAYLARQDDPEAHLRSILADGRELPFYLTLPVLQSLEPPVLGMDPAVDAVLRQAATVGAYAPRTLAPAPSVSARDHDAQVTLLRDSGRTVATRGQLQDFVRYFNDRYETLAKMLRRRREVANAVPIRQAHAYGKEVQLIGYVSDVKKSPNGHVFIDLEDDSGTVTLLALGTDEHLVGEAQTLLPDEVVGVVAAAGRDGDLLLAKHIVRPDIPYANPASAQDVAPIAAAFLSDIHVGSKTFLPKPFERLIDWLNGRTGTRSERALAMRVKYLVLAGDIVDGVGIYPGQETALDITQIEAQYRRLAQILELLPDHMHVVVQPGNHDAVRPTEPQPPFGKEIRGLFDHLDTTFVSNPSTFTLHGRTVLSYHGYSMVDFATRVPGLRMDDPIPIMRRMLQSRHVAPTYGAATPLSPEEKDYLVIDRVPDIFVTGHVHVNGLETHRGVTLVNAGTWQTQTDYQRMHNLVPTPAKMPVVDLSTLTGTLVDFAGA